ncbi:alcohol dehydrogenase [Limnohabitans sp. Hippo4]|uniref:alcohol dehydrogenase n=1 Tax=Limnohabitans sp. Hippo4 TaxID=1826167 RepID=UPI001304D31D|nr:alcohol dehydrogenase [Limnohabitans sp. Hippo4]
MSMISYQVEAFGRPLAQVIRDIPNPLGSEVVIKVGSCGVCHSDVHLHDGYFDLGNDIKLDMTRTVKPPRTLGHEIAGTVVAVGPEVKGVKVGDKRVVFPWIGCGTCALCETGNEHLCNSPQALGIHRDGGFASHTVVPHERYLLDYGNLPEEQACTYACSGLTAYSALKKVAPLGPKDPLLIIGAGGVGLSGIRLARQMFETPPIVLELDKSKWDIAREAGAGEIIDPNAEGALKSLMKATGGVAAAIDFVGAAATFNFGFQALRKAGKLVCVGLFGGSSPIVPAMVSMKAVSVTGSYVGSLQEMQELMVIAKTGVLPDLPLGTQSLDTATQALEDLRAGRIRGRTILK